MDFHGHQNACAARRAQAVFSHHFVLDGLYHFASGEQSGKEEDVEKMPGGHGRLCVGFRHGEGSVLVHLGLKSLRSSGDPDAGAGLW